MSVRTLIKVQRTGTLVMGLVALSVAILTALLLPGRAEAQEEEQAATNTTTTTTVGPGDSLWAIAQARLAPEAAPQQVAEEVERIYALNQRWIGEDPNLLLVGQELLVSPVVRPAESEEPVSAASMKKPATTHLRPSPRTKRRGLRPTQRLLASQQKKDPPRRMRSSP